MSATLEGLSVNDAIPVEAGAVSYNTVDNVVRMIQGYGQVSVLGNTDVEHAYKLVPIPALGMGWGGRGGMRWIALNQQGAQRKLKLFKKFCEVLGIPIVEHKTEWGTTLVFLGIELDTIKMEARRPEEKLKKCLGLLKRHG